jgi:hypothetical protein
MMALVALHQIPFAFFSLLLFPLGTELLNTQQFRPQEVRKWQWAGDVKEIQKIVHVHLLTSSC